MTRGKDIVQRNQKNEKDFFFWIKTPFLEFWLDHKLSNVMATVKKAHRLSLTPKDIKQSDI